MVWTIRLRPGDGEESVRSVENGGGMGMKIVFRRMRSGGMGSAEARRCLGGGDQSRPGGAGSCLCGSRWWAIGDNASPVLDESRIADGGGAPDARI